MLQILSTGESPSPKWTLGHLYEQLWKPGAVSMIKMPNVCGDGVNSWAVIQTEIEPSLIIPKIMVGVEKWKVLTSLYGFLPQVWRPLDQWN